MPGTLEWGAVNCAALYWQPGESGHFTISLRLFCQLQRIVIMTTEGLCWELLQTALESRTPSQARLGEFKATLQPFSPKPEGKHFLRAKACANTVLHVLEGSCQDRCKCHPSFVYESSGMGAKRPCGSPLAALYAGCVAQSVLQLGNTLLCCPLVLQCQNSFFFSCQLLFIIKRDTDSNYKDHRSGSNNKNSEATGSRGNGSRKSTRKREETDEEKP